MLRCAFCDYGSAAVSAFWSNIYDIVGSLNHIKIMLNDYYTVTALSQSL